MPAVPRQKACNACADSKRRCDKQLPECQRCLDRDVDCVYPQPKRRRKDAPARGGQELAASQNYGDIDALGSGFSFDFGDWGTMGAADPPDMIIPYIPSLPMSVASPSAQGTAPESTTISGLCSPYLWFLHGETWDLRHSPHDPACVTTVELEPFIRAVEEMLQCWVRNGHNSFIHGRLFEKGMPTCLQDAFTTLAAYVGRTPAVKETILQIAHDRASVLVHQSTPTAAGAKGILDHLARVQALFVYEFIQLFDVSARLRASAERLLPTLRRWVVQMWEVVRQYQGEDSSIGRHPLQWMATNFDREYDASSEVWRLWILTESVRRTHLVVDTVMNIQEIMTVGIAECPGSVMFTGRRGLWEAQSALKWVELCSAGDKPPCLVPPLHPGPLISQYAAEEFDDFAIFYWTFIIGSDKIQYWIDKSSKTGGT